MPRNDAPGSGGRGEIVAKPFAVRQSRTAGTKAVTAVAPPATEPAQRERVIAAIPAKFRARARRDAAAFYLSQLAKGVLAGELAIVVGEQQIQLATSEFVLLEIEAKQRKRANHVQRQASMAEASTDPSRCGRREIVMGDSREFEFEGAATPSEAADTLNRIADGIRARSLSLSMGDEEITVYPDGDLALEIEASEKKGKAKIEIAIAWKQAKDRRGR